MTFFRYLDTIYAKPSTSQINEFDIRLRNAINNATTIRDLMKLLPSVRQSDIVNNASNSKSEYLYLLGPSALFSLLQKKKNSLLVSLEFVPGEYSVLSYIN